MTGKCLVDGERINKFISKSFFGSKIKENNVDIFIERGIFNLTNGGINIIFSYGAFTLTNKKMCGIYNFYNKVKI